MQISVSLTRILLSITNTFMSIVGNCLRLHIEQCGDLQSTTNVSYWYFANDLSTAEIGLIFFISPNLFLTCTQTFFVQNIFPQNENKTCFLWNELYKVQNVGLARFMW